MRPMTSVISPRARAYNTCIPRDTPWAALSSPLTSLHYERPRGIGPPELLPTISSDADHVEQSSKPVRRVANSSIRCFRRPDPTYLHYAAELLVINRHRLNPSREPAASG